MGTDVALILFLAKLESALIFLGYIVVPLAALKYLFSPRRKRWDIEKD